jgi:hypothetical protein
MPADNFYIPVPRQMGSSARATSGTTLQLNDDLMGLLREKFELWAVRLRFPWTLVGIVDIIDAAWACVNVGG